MKKFVLLIMVALITLGASYEAKAQNLCDLCVSPDQCATFTTTMGSCGSPIKVTICYHCDVSGNNTNLHAEILDISNICTSASYSRNRQLIDEAWDAAYDWIRMNAASLCGRKNCKDNQYSEIFITKFACGELIFDGYKFEIKSNLTQVPSCDYRCTNTYRVCWCICSDGGSCTQPPPCTDHFEWWYVTGSQYYSGDGSCEEIEFGQGTLYPTEPGGDWWSIPCLSFDCPER
ncbi:MAG: hypothetical protein HW421_992 [Ignavibacteria bacterium]|nr:hypothetical protein [Ignavibacteria bacterium]